jgi:hypothetical protein
MENKHFFYIEFEFNTFEMSDQLSARPMCKRPNDFCIFEVVPWFFNNISSEEELYGWLENVRGKVGVALSSKHKPECFVEITNELRGQWNKYRQFLSERNDELRCELIDRLDNLKVIFSIKKPVIARLCYNKMKCFSNTSAEIRIYSVI